MTMETITAVTHFGRYKYLIYWYKDILTIYLNRIEFRDLKIFSTGIREKYLQTYYTWEFNY